MLEYIENGDLVITPNIIKKQILKEISEKKIILNIKFMTIEEFINNYFEKTDEKSLYHLMKEFSLNYDVAKDILKNIIYKPDCLLKYYNYLKDKNLIYTNKYFKDSLKNIKVIGYNNFDKFIENELSKYNTTYIKNKSLNYKHEVYEFNSQTEELEFIISDIIEKLNKIDINDICIVGVESEYVNELSYLSKILHLPIDFKSPKKIYSTNTVQKFIQNLKDTKDITESLENLCKDEIYNEIIKVLNKYVFIDNIDDIYIEIIINELKCATISSSKLDNSVKCININEMVDPNKYYYIIGFNQGVIPKVYKENSFIPDSKAHDYGVSTSLDKIKAEKTNIKNILSNYKNITITYKLKDNYNIYYPSPLINELEFTVKKVDSNILKYSNKYNNILLSKKLDSLTKYNTVEKDLYPLLNTYPNYDYNSYDNKYKKIDINSLYKYLNNEINVSYSSMNNYFLCPFRYYVQNILKLDVYEVKFATTLGNIYHEVLSHLYDDNFDFETVYKEVIEKYELTNKEKFFMLKLKEVLKYDIDIIKKQDSYSNYKKALTEKEVIIDKSNKLKINFKGYVDKIKVSEDEKSVAIIDYKTGFIKTDLDNINYGLNLQLPVYAYLVKNGLYTDARIVGFYLQKLLDTVPADCKNVEIEKEKNLYLNGYSNSDMDLLEQFDTTYTCSNMIKSMKVGKNGFYHYTKTINDTQIDKMIEITDKKINEVIEASESAEFDISPIKIDDKLIGCEFCKFKDLCFKKEEDIKCVKSTKFIDIIKDDEIDE